MERKSMEETKKKRYGRKINKKNGEDI